MVGRFHAVSVLAGLVLLLHAGGAWGLDCQALKESVGPHIYRILVAGDQGKGAALTGFRVQGREGLFTAFHGLVGAREITAEPASGKGPELKGFRIIEVDKWADVARIAIEDEPRLAAGDGLAVAAEAAGPLCALGFPFQREEFAADRMKIRGAPTKLARLVGTVFGMKEFLDFLREAGSPDTQFPMLDISGEIAPGHSGAPLVDATGAVAAVANGSLLQGNSLYSWATPLAATCFFTPKSDCSNKHVPVADMEAKILAARATYEEALKKAGLREVSVRPLPIRVGETVTKREADVAIGVHRTVETAVTLMGCDKARLTTTVDNGDFLFGFCMRTRVAFQGIGGDGSEFAHVVTSDRFCTVSQFEIEAALAGLDLLEDPQSAAALQHVLPIRATDLEELRKYKDTRPTRQISLDGIKLPSELCAATDGSGQEYRPGVYRIDIIHEVDQKPDGLRDSLQRLKGALGDLAHFFSVARDVCKVSRELSVAFGRGPITCPD